MADTKVKHKSWMTDEILGVMEDRRECKGLDPDEYEALQRKVRNKIREAVEAEASEICKEIEELQIRYDTFNLHKKIKEVTEGQLFGVPLDENKQMCG